MASNVRVDASVVLCCYQAEQRILPVLEALLAQDHPATRWELIVVDDASTDATATVVARRLKGVRNARLLVHTRNKGLGGARNTGIAAAKGEFILFTDDDCIPPRHWVSWAVARFRKQPASVGALAGDVRIPRHSYVADCISYMGFPAGGNLGFRRMFLVDAAGMTTSFTTANAMVRRSVLSRLEGPFDEALRKVQDKDLALRIQQLGYRIRYCDDLTVMHMPMPSVAGFLRRMYVKGRYGSLIAQKHKGQQRAYAGLRARALANTFKAPPNLLPGMLPLTVFGYGAAAFGYLVGWLRPAGRTPRR